MADGGGADPVRADVAIDGGRVTAIGDLATAAAAARVLDVSGLVVAPGFIDIHAHSDEAMFVNPPLESALHMGVTTVANGNCGGSSAPVAGQAAADLRRDLARYDVVPSWSSFAEYRAAVERNGVSINVCSFAGHGTVRASVLGAAARAAEPGELREMRAGVERAMTEGAVGVSFGLIYPPSAYGPLDELVAIAEVVAAHGGVCAAHLRNEGDRLFEAVDEMIEVGRRSGARIQISHHKAALRRNWGRVRESTARIARARSEGVDVAADQYPYTASSTGLAVVVPNWAHDGGALAMCARLADPAVRDRIRAEETETGRAWDAMVIAQARHEPAWSGRTVAGLAREAGQDPLDWTCEALIRHEGSIDMVHHSMDEADVRFVMSLPWVCIGSDSLAKAPYGPLSFGVPHPRAYGTFPRVLGRYARDAGLFPLGEAVRKMTALPAARLGLRDRGTIRVGAPADLVVFDAGRVIDEATYEDPHRYPTGIAHVLVNGVLALEDGRTTAARAGRFLAP